MHEIHKTINICAFIDTGNYVYFAVYGATVAIGRLLAKPYLTSFPTTTVGCNVTDSSMISNLTSPVFDPVAYDPYPHYQ